MTVMLQKEWNKLYGIIVKCVEVTKTYNRWDEK